MAALSSSLPDAITEVAAAVDACFDRMMAVPDDPRAQLYECMRHAAIGGG